MMNSSWNLGGDASQYKSYKKGWSGDDTAPASKPRAAAAYERKNKDPDGNPTLRSGLMSSESPFEHMNGYYEKQTDPVRQSMANSKHISEPTRQYKQITGQQSANNPFTGTINDKYENHIGNTQAPQEHPQPLASKAIEK